MDTGFIYSQTGILSSPTAPPGGFLQPLVDHHPGHHAPLRALHAELPDHGLAPATRRPVGGVVVPPFPARVAVDDSLDGLPVAPHSRLACRPLKSERPRPSVPRWLGWR